ncbi:hypothetical protein, partial [Bacillus subtilis]|uniref:hypothetical protein n=1 Tax=Bacillus subtilis TaxID=1423 RepID=UPI00338DC850
FTDRTRLQAYPLLLLPKSNTPYQNLLKITSVLQSKSKPRLKPKSLHTYPQPIIPITPGQKPYIQTLLQRPLFQHPPQPSLQFHSI